MLGIVVGLLSGAIWLYLIVARGRFWDVELPSADPGSSAGVHVIAVIPARNEAEDIGATIASLLRQQFDGRLGIVLVDDHSEDGTADIARKAAGSLADRLTILQAPPLPSGWTGKLWAVNTGVAHAIGGQPDFLLLTDADIRHDSTHVETLVRRALSHRLDLTSEMVLLRCVSWIERRLIPAFVFFFFMLYPPRWAADPRRRLAAAAGGCMLIRPAILDKIGGIGAIRAQLIDDCALAAAVKRRGGRIRLDVTDAAHSLRRYDTPSSIWSMIARSAYTQLGESPWALVGTVIGLALTYLAPAVLVIAAHGSAELLGIGIMAAMTFAFGPTLRLYGISRVWGLSLPAIAVFYGAATIGSAIAHWRGLGGAWKGRVKPLPG